MPIYSMLQQIQQHSISVRTVVFFICTLSTSSGIAQTFPSLLAAIKSNDYETAKRMLDDGTNPNSVDVDGDPMLLNAALYSSPRIIELMLQKGADPNIKNKDGETALMWSIQDTEKVKLLLSKGADVNAKATSGNTALMVASVGANQFNIVKLLLDHGANPLLTNARKETPLMRAALFGDTATLALLVKAGNEIDATDSTELTALINAIFNVNRQATIWLLDHGADADKIGAFGLTAVTAVVTYNDLPSVNAVLAKAKNINTVDTLGISALMWAAYNEHDNPAIIKALLDKGADVNLRAKNGETALVWALRKGNNKTVTLLKKAGAL